MKQHKEKYTPSPNETELETLTEFHKAIGDLNRIKILWKLMDGERCVGELAKEMDMTESAMSHQLRILKFSRLIRSHKSGKNVIYVLDDEHIRWILEETYAHISER